MLTNANEKKLSDFVRVLQDLAHHRVFCVATAPEEEDYYEKGGKYIHCLRQLFGSNRICSRAFAVWHSEHLRVIEVPLCFQTARVQGLTESEDNT